MKRFLLALGAFLFAAQSVYAAGTLTTLGVGPGVLSGGACGPVLVDRTAGTNIGDLTLNGGLAAAFDGTTSQTGAASASATGVTNAYVGKTTVGNKVFYSATVYGGNNSGFVAGTDPTMTINIRGKASAPSSATDGTILGTTGSFTDTSDESAGRAITSNGNATAWADVWVELALGGSANPRVAEFVWNECL